jgi:exosortase
MRPRSWSWYVGPGLCCAILWAYWTTLVEMGERWFDDPQYSHGYLVPLFSLYLLWARRSIVKHGLGSPSWWGVFVLVLALGMRLGGVYFFYGFFDAISLLLCLGGLALVLGGGRALRWSWPAILFLGFMVPLPFRLQTALGGVLQRIATKMSTYCLQTLGAPAVSEGNIILINDMRIGVVEACNGLGMLVTFFAISTAAAMLLKHGWWRRLALIIGAIPIAILANVVRITVTGLLYSASQGKAAQVVFHDVAGLLMMPLAVLFIFMELFVLDRLIVDRRGVATESGPIAFLPSKVVAQPAAR